MRRAFIWLGFVAEVLLLVLILTHLSGCTTVTPTEVHSSAPSYDGNAQNSGILAALPAGILVTPHLRDRYNALVTVYGRDFVVPLKEDAGFMPAPDGVNLVMDREHFTKFLQMNQWQKAGLKPIHQ